MSWWSLAAELDAIKEHFDFLENHKIVRGLYKTGPATSSTTIFHVSLPRVQAASAQHSGGVALGSMLRIAVIQPTGGPGGPWTEARMYEDYLEPLRAVIEPFGWQFTEAMVGSEDDKQTAYIIDCNWQKSVL